MNQGELDKIREIGGNDYDLGLKFKETVSVLTKLSMSKVLVGFERKTNKKSKGME